MPTDVIPFPTPQREPEPRQRRTLGEILVALGRISPADVERALTHQRAHGGYFGDALITLGVLTRSELNWALADQSDLPFVQLDPDAIDRAVAAAVPAAWAREHLILPVLRSGGVVTVVLDSPGGLEKLDEVRRFTGAEAVEAALAAPENIRALIEAVHGAHGPPVPLAQLFAAGVEAGAERLGISVRPGRATAWYVPEGADSVHRALGAEWAAELEALVSPLSPLPSSPVHEVRSWPALLTLPDASWRVDCHALGRGEALEWTAAVGHRIPITTGAAPLDEALADALRDACRAATVTVRVHPGEDDGAASAEEIVEAALAALPAALFGADFRALHLSDRPVVVAPGQLYLLVRDRVGEALTRTRPFALQGLTLDVERLSDTELEMARRTAPFVAFRARSHDDPAPSADFDLRLRLTADGPVWSR